MTISTINDRRQLGFSIEQYEKLSEAIHKKCLINHKGDLQMLHNVKTKKIKNKVHTLRKMYGESSMIMTAYITMLQNHLRKRRKQPRSFRGL